MSMLYLGRLALKNPECSWDRTNNPEPWNKLGPNDQYKLSVNGYIAFFNPYFISQVPNQNLSKDIIAPLWTYLNAGSEGKLTYEAATSEPLIDQVNQEIARMFSYVNISATWVFVATWANAPIDFNSYQTGYGKEDSYFVTLPVNNAYELSSSTNVNIPGRWAFQFTALFPMGSDAIQFHPSNGACQTIYLQQEFKYNGKTYTQAYLSVNGYVAFFDPYFVTQVPNQYLGKDIIAPLWTYLNAANGGKLTYEQATSGPLIDLVNQELNRMFPYENISATWVFVATWKNVPVDFYPFQEVTFQVVLASVGKNYSIVLMNYENIPYMYYYNWLSNATHIILQNTVWATEGIGFISRSGGLHITISCVYPLIHSISMPTDIQATGDGYISFYIPNINKEVPDSQLGKDLIAPLWTDLNVTDGEKKYEQATRGFLIDMANEEINRMFSHAYFSAHWVFVATWENVSLRNDSYTTSFQVILASDGLESSFVLMNYRIIPYISPGHWLAGYGMENRDFVKIPVNEAYELVLNSNVNITGRWAFQCAVAPCSNLSCSSNEVCRQINGVYGCACGYITTSSPNIYDPINTCSGTAGSLSLSRCLLFEAGYDADVLHLNDPNCKGELQSDRLVFSFDSNTCGTTLENNNTHIILKNNVEMTNAIGVISRDGGFNIAVSCVYPLIQSISMPTSIDATGSVVSVNHSTEGLYQISMIPYTDDTFTVSYSGNVMLEVNHQMYISVQVDRFDSTQVALVIDSCWATPVDQIDYSVHWDLIVNECPNPNDGTVAVLQNGVSTSSHFSFRMFTFTGLSNNIYLHCQVHLCLQNTENCTRLSMDGYVTVDILNVDKEILNPLGKDIITPLWLDIEAKQGGR
ncbi:Pancreatic secretory granule membrane major glycoprotein GP2 [Bagarius yarrelli]|uniref:Pancreatic secretory granule membrane major glycoprotein GP2 n=1 Tax=Bagarius yarrelli TaxID=175774 RepID=A0A556U0Y0_BAGYA|nr:Pancreatic secretory granule membrane major glycoprotein GP2 [Bagarius yarrelli]